MRGPAMLVAACIISVSAAVSADPRANFILHCGGCHLPDAAGVPPSVPSLRNTLGLIVATPEGRDYIVRVPGASQTPLTDDELAAVMNWVLLTYNQDTLPANFKLLSGREVGKSRSRVLADPQKLRDSLWPDY